jgi:predicted nucleotidyltransferase
MITNLKDTSAILQKIIKDRYPQVRRAWIFGSMASNTFSSESDLDLLIDPDSPMGLRFISLAEDLEAAIGRKVDLLTMEQAQMLDQQYGYNIMGKAAPIYDRTA